jgi:hypothetical protein
MSVKAIDEFEPERDHWRDDDEPPFGIGELMARLRAALRHADQERHEPTQIESEGFCIDFVKHFGLKFGDRLFFDGLAQAESSRH